MSRLTNWWKNTSLREKALLLTLLILVNVALFLQSDANVPPNSSLPTAVIQPLPTKKVAAASGLTSKTLVDPAISAPAQWRDPFRPPVGLKPVSPPSEEPVQATVNRNNTVVTAAPSETEHTAAVITPVLTGIMTDGSDKKLAIIEYDGCSRYYHLYDAIGPFTLADIEIDHVTLVNPNKSLRLALRR